MPKKIKEETVPAPPGKGSVKSSVKPGSPAEPQKSLKSAGKKGAVAKPPGAVKSPGAVKGRTSAKKPGAVRLPASRKKAPDIEISSDEVALRAYYIAERRQRMGWLRDSADDWLEAEAQLREEARAAARRLSRK